MCRLTYKEIEGMETFASSSDSEDDEPCDPGNKLRFYVARLAALQGLSS